MNARIPLYPVLLTLLVLATPAWSASNPSTHDKLQSAISGPQRSAAHKQRDSARHPLKTLEFFDVQPDMRVIEVLPEGGWYTEILAPFINAKGQLIEASFPPSSDKPFYRKMATKFRRKLAASPDIYGDVQVEPFSLPSYMPLGAPHSADRVLTFRNLHDFVFTNVHGAVSDAALQRFLGNVYQVLKPGGVLGVVSHRAPADMSVAKSHKLGRLPQPWLVREARQAGLKLEASAAINANSKDPRTEPVYYLPPTLKQGQKNRAKYKAIGEADNMTLKFVKPKPGADQTSQ
ncbi:class I SAM-dependent methyltransferase [Salinisphaera orenii]|uniref:class I SAM-dependent methyltransferase n=1 Tax=Salinisphaera orenii TaxID=856731 RepID=UPI000DBE9A7C